MTVHFLFLFAGQDQGEGKGQEEGSLPWTPPADACVTATSDASKASLGATIG